jgi:hypothetical protein
MRIAAGGVEIYHLVFGNFARLHRLKPYVGHHFAEGWKGAGLVLLACVRRFSTRAGIHKSREQCESFVAIATEAEHGASL